MIYLGIGLTIFSIAGVYGNPGRLKKLSVTKQFASRLSEVLAALSVDPR